jgi:MFS family permease
MENQTINRPRTAEKKHFYGYVIVALTFVIMMIAWIPYYAFGVFFTPMSSEFGWTRAVTSGAFSASQIMRGIFGIVMGRLNDKVGPRVVLTISAVILGAGFILMYFIHSLWQFYFFFAFLMGIGLSGFWVPVLSTLARWFAKKRATMSGITMAATGLATLIGAPFANLLLSNYDWRISYAILGILILLIIPVLAQFLKRDPSEVGQFPDGEKGNPEQKKLAAIGLSLAEALRSSHFWLYFLAAMSIAYCTFTFVVHIVPYSIGLNMSPSAAAVILAAYGALNVVGRLALGNAADKIGDRQIYLIGFTLTAISFFGLIVTNQIWALYVFAAIAGLAQGGMGAVGSPLLAELFGLRSHGLIFGVANVGFTIGAAIGPIVTGYIFDVTGSYQGAFILCLIVSILGFIFSVLLKRPNFIYGKKSI